MNLLHVGEFHGSRLHTALRLDYRLRMWAPTSTMCAVSVVYELLVVVVAQNEKKYQVKVAAKTC